MAHPDRACCSRSGSSSTADALALAALLFAQQGDEAALRARVAAQPPAIQSFIARRANCNHWGGEEPYDEPRRREIERAVRDLGCATLRGEEIFLRRYFANRPEILALLTDTEEQSGW